VENAEPVVLTGVEGDKNVLGTQASFTCKANYAMVGDAIRTCQQDGTWTGTQPRCIAHPIYAKVCDCPFNTTNCPLTLSHVTNIRFAKFKIYIFLATDMNMEETSQT